MAKFTDSIDENVELLGELLRGLTPGQQQQAKRAYGTVGNVVHGLRKDYPKNPAVLIGASLAIYTLAQQMVKAGDEGAEPGEQGLIQLLN